MAVSREEVTQLTKLCLMSAEQGHGVPAREAWGRRSDRKARGAEWKSAVKSLRGGGDAQEGSRTSSV
jgi:hypothetical protein